MLNSIFRRAEDDSSFNHRELLPALFATLGVACLELGGSLRPGIGDAWALLQPIFFGLSFWRIEKLFFQNKENIDAISFTAGMMFMVAGLSSLWVIQDLAAHEFTDALRVVHSQIKSLSQGNVVFSLLWTGVVTTAVTSLVENQSMKILSAAESTVIYSTEPLWGTVVASYMLNEHIGLNTAVGALCILLACGLSAIGSEAWVNIFSSYTTGFLESIENAQEKFSDMISSITENMEPLKIS
jgi:drug/metabolite transporter (DMT)-like permease